MVSDVAQRHPKRLQVRFQRVGESVSYVGYTVNVSRTGIFVGTIHPAPPNAAVLIAFSDLEATFMVEGIVVHAARVSPIFRSVQRSGMGVKFLEPLERIRRWWDARRPPGKRLHCLSVGETIALEEAS